MSRGTCILTIHGKPCEYPKGISFQEIARDYQSQYEDDIVLVQFQNNLRELKKIATRDGELKFITTADKAGRDTYRRSATFLMETASDALFPELGLLVQHSIGQGYYCEFRKQGDWYASTEEMLAQLKEKMCEFARQDLPIVKHNMNTQDAMYQFSKRGREDKVRLLRYRRSSRINVYELNGYMDYYYGYMLPSTGYLKYFDLKLYQNGFMLMFPDKKTKETAEFKPSDKLFWTLDDSARWGEDMGVRTVGELNDVIASGKIQDLILVQESWMEQKIGEIAGKIAADKQKKIILVAGPSSSGKTTFSHRLSIQLTAHGLKPHPISMDDFYVNREDTPRDEYGELDFECLEALDIALFNETMQALLDGKDVLLPVFNFKTGHREFRPKPLRLGAEDVLVIEGIHGLNEKLSYELPKESKFKIYISALTQLNIDAHNNLPTTDGRLLRRIVRDARTRNTTARETLARWNSVRRGEEKNIFPYQEESDEMFNSALIYELSVLKLYAEPLLFSIGSDCPEYAEAKRLLKFLDYFLPVPGENIGHNSILREFIGGSCFHV
jgi:uridine kinase